VSHLQGFPTFRVLASTWVPIYICPNKAEVSKRQYSSKAKSCNVHYLCHPMVQYCILGYEEITDIGTLSFRWILPFWYFCYIFAYKANLDLYAKIKQKYQNGNIQWEPRVPTSEREGKLSNPSARSARAMHGENLRKFMETRVGAPRARYALISSWPSIQYVYWIL
jgi:hypothetical protein